jgi:AAA15 family ATPase/GTPase
MGVAEESEVSKPLFEMMSIEDARRGAFRPPSRGQILNPLIAGFLKKNYYPFFEDYNNDFLINKKMKIKDDLSVIIVTDSGSVIPYSKLSHGELRLMHMLSTISDNPKMGGRWPTILIDEPEVGLHIDWQRKLVTSIKGHYEVNPPGFGGEKLGVEWEKHILLPVKVIIATHSPEIVGSSPEDAVSIEPLSDELR